MPDRIQLRRTKGWRLPAGVIVVDRRSPWGNPFRVGDMGVPDAATAVALFRSAILLADYCETLVRAQPSTLLMSFTSLMPGPVPRLDAIGKHLRGRDLACWCPPGCPCHADVLLELANP